MRFIKLCIKKIKKNSIGKSIDKIMINDAVQASLISGHFYVSQNY